MTSFIIFAILSVAMGNAAPVDSVESVDPESTIYPIANCGAASAFKFHNIAYEKYINSPGNYDTPPDSLTFSFEVTNSATDVVTECSFGSSPSQSLTDTRWYTCGARTIADTGGSQYTVQTNAHFGWSTWVLSVNQSWVCENGAQQTTVKGTSVSSLTPACTDTSQGDPSSMGWQVTECTVPDTDVAMALS